MSGGDYIKAIEISKEEIYMQKPEVTSVDCVIVTASGIEALKEKIAQLQKDKKMMCKELENTINFWHKQILKIRDENKKLRQALVKCNNERTWCYSCGAAMGKLMIGEKHSEDCEYIKLTKGE